MADDGTKTIKLEFDYEALANTDASDGGYRKKTVTGTIESASLTEATLEIRALNLFPTKVTLSKVGKLREFLRDENHFDSSVHAAVCEALEILDDHFGKGIIKDDIAYKLDKMVKSAIKERAMAGYGYGVVMEYQKESD